MFSMLTKVFANLLAGRRMKLIYICLIIVGAYLIWNSISPTSAAPLTDQERAEIIDSVRSLNIHWPLCISPKGHSNGFVAQEKFIQWRV